VNRILILIKGLGRGGAEQLVVSAAPYFDRSRFDYEVAYLLPWKNALVGALEEQGIRVQCLDGHHNIGWIARLRGLVADRRIDLIHAHSPVPAVGTRLAFYGRSRPRLVYTEHNVWHRYHPATYWANLLTFPLNHHVFAVSNEVRHSIRYPPGLRSFRVPAVETLYYGIDREAIARAGPSDGIRAELGISPDAAIVGTVANFKAHKGHAYLLQAALQVRGAIPDVKFVLVGQGPLEQDIRRSAHDLGLDQTVIFAGYREDVHRVMKAFDVFALPSVYDGLSIALIEAMSLGKPPVVTRAGGNPEAVEHGKHGLVVPPGDPQALASSILTLLRNGSVRRHLAQAARARAGAFDIRSAVRRTEQVYEEWLA
jgi:glycosyltransferase involved in cell wall biosynthesis